MAISTGEQKSALAAHLQSSQIAERGGIFCGVSPEQASAVCTLGFTLAVVMHPEEVKAW